MNQNKLDKGLNLTHVAVIIKDFEGAASDVLAVIQIPKNSTQNKSDWIDYYNYKIRPKNGDQANRVEIHGVI
jgi:hypothetical protein